MHKLLLLLLVFSCKTVDTKDETAYNKFLQEFDVLFYSEKQSHEKMDELFNIIDIAKKDGYYDNTLRSAINNIEQKYSSIISDSVISELWVTNKTSYGGPKKSIIIESLGIKSTQYYLDLLENNSAQNQDLKHYKEYFEFYGVIPTSIDFLNIIEKLDLSIPDNRLIFYLHMVVWSSSIQPISEA